MDTTSGLIGQTLGQYRIIEQIGEGGMATVFKAYQPGLNRDIALKILPPHFAKQADFTERFVREAQAIGNLHHPNILPVYDSGQDKGYSYLAMRYIPNARTLTHEMKSPMKTERIIEVMSQIGGALDHAHKTGIIHRDVKPSNVLLDGQWALLSDFGLAKMVENPGELTGTGVGMGTPAYMSPEQAMGKKVDHRTDLYALGIILYELLTGQVPHKAETPIATVMKRINEPLPLPRSINPNIPEAVERVLLKALAVDPTDRFDSASDLITALKAAFGPDPGEVLAGVSPAFVTPSKTAPASTAEKTKLAAPAVEQGAPGKAGLPAKILGFGAVGALLLLLLVCGGAFVAYRMWSANPATQEPIARNTATLEVQPGESGAEATPIAPPTEELIAQNTATVESSAEATPITFPTEELIESPTPQPTSEDANIVSSGDTLLEATTAPEPTEAPIDPGDTPAPVITALTGQEAHKAALVEAQKWQPDAVLSEISTSGMGLLDAEGKSTGWLLNYWSPSTKHSNSLMLLEGMWMSAPSEQPVPKAVVIDESIILDTKRLYDIAAAAGAAEFTSEGYAPMASLTPYPLDETQLTWYLNYMGGDYRVVFTVIIDAKTGEVMQAIKTE